MRCTNTKVCHACVLTVLFFLEYIYIYIYILLKFSYTLGISLSLGYSKNFPVRLISYTAYPLRGSHSPGAIGFGG